MANTYFIALGSRANGFYDQITGITVARGEKVEITEKQRNTKKIQMALNAGALQLVQPDTEVKALSEADIKKLDKKIKDKFDKGVTIDKICSNLTMDQAEALAKLNEIEVEKDDTIVDIIKAIVDDSKEE